MNTPSDDENPLADTSFERAAWRGIGLLSAVMAAYVCLIFSLPRPFKAVVGLGGMFFICLGVLGFALWLAPRSPLMKQARPAARRYILRFLPAMMVYGMVFIVASWVYRLMHPIGVEAVLVALAPSVPVLFAIRALMLYLKDENDEFLRSRMLESWSLATVGALAVCTMYGFLDVFRIVPHLELWAVFPIWAVCLFPAHRLVKRGQ